jgi:hypothetical protein
VFAFSSVDSFFIFSAAFRAISSSAIFVLSMSNFHGLGVSHECLFGLHFFYQTFHIAIGFFTITRQSLFFISRWMDEHEPFTNWLSRYPLNLHYQPRIKSAPSTRRLRQERLQTMLRA